MQKFKIEIEETLTRVVEVEAETADEAVSKVEESYNAQEIVLDSEDYFGTKYNVVSDEVEAQESI